MGTKKKSFLLILTLEISNKFSTLEEKYEAESGKNERHKNYVKKSKQKLSFDDIDLNIPKKGFPSMNALMKAHLSCSDISSMQIHDVEKEEFQKNEIEMERKAKTKSSGLKRVKWTSFEPLNEHID